MSLFYNSLSLSLFIYVALFVGRLAIMNMFNFFHLFPHLHDMLPSLHFFSFRNSQFWLSFKSGKTAQFLYPTNSQIEDSSPSRTFNFNAMNKNACDVSQLLRKSISSVAMP